MITYYFGLPGCGKTTLLVAKALEFNDLINSGKSRYSRVLSNVPFSLPEGVVSNCFLFENSDFGHYDMSDAYVLYDESSDDLDCRSYNSLDPAVRYALMHHRHEHQNLFFFNQLADGIDKKVRMITNNVYYVKPSFTGRKLVPMHVGFDIFIPRKPSQKELMSMTNSGQITQLYYRPGLFDNLFHRLFVERSRVYKKYYSYFDSFDRVPLPKKEFKQL